MVQFAIPSIIAMLVGALYNIVDQLFIGWSVGPLGNAATNIAFPFSMVCTSIALMFGIGGASCFNLSMGRGEKTWAAYFIGNALTGIAVLGLVLCFVTRLNLNALLILCGSPEEVLPYARDYVGITAIGFPFLILTIAGGHLIRADGNPRMTMICNLSGALINVVLDYIFVMRLHMGMAGAAYATIIGQVFSGILVISYMCRFRTVPLKWQHLILKIQCLGQICAIGAASFFNQLAMMVVQVVLNNSLKNYGADSVYGSSIPIACAGIVTKVFQVFFSVVIGLSQGAQPIESFNYGAENYGRVKEAYKKALLVGFAVSFFSFALFQIFPRRIIALFGEGSEEYYEFGVNYFRIFMFFIFLNCMQPITATFFTSIGKPIKGIFLSLTRQIIYFLPLVICLPKIFGIDGILYSAPIADFLAAITTVIMAVAEFRDMNKLEAEKGKCTLVE
ncbi:MAG: MATE family efflux transporter [Lachnospiraceae bacterium]